MQNFVPALLRLTARPRYWRIAVILPGHILWRTYSRVEYPTPDDAVLRCLAGLVQPPKHAKQHEQSPTPCQRFAFDFGEYPPESERACHRGPKPEHRLPAIDGDKAMQHGLPHALSAKQAKNPRYEQDQRDTQPFLAGHAQPRRQFLGGPQNKISEDSQSEGGNVEDVNAIHPRPLPPVRVRAAWWGWL